MAAEENPAPAADTCPLSQAQQTRNMWIYAITFWMQYLAAPVTYLGSTQATLCQDLGASVTVANLPSTLFFAFAFGPLLLAWYSPFVRTLRINSVLCFAANATSMVAVAVVLVLPLPAWLKITVVIVQSAIAGVAGPAAGGVFLWEALARGVAQSRRGEALAITFGAGPLLAVVGSYIQQGILPADPTMRFFPSLDFPFNYATLYALCAPLIFFNAYLCSQLVIPLPAQEVPREPFVEGVFGGIGNYLQSRVLMLAFVAAVLVYAGNLIPSNMTLYTKFAIGGEASNWAGTSSMFRFGVKAVAGVFLGWLLAKTNPRAGFLVTAGFFIAAQVWGMLVTGPWYLAAFGLFGAGELVGVYGPNYILSASRPADLRRNMALATLVSLPAAAAGPLFGWITDHYSTYFSLGGAAGPMAATYLVRQIDGDLGYRLSFAACATLMSAGFLLTLFALPARPRPDGDPPPPI